MHNDDLFSKLIEKVKQSAIKSTFHKLNASVLPTRNKISAGPKAGPLGPKCFSSLAREKPIDANGILWVTRPYAQFQNPRTNPPGEKSKVQPSST